MANLGAPEVRIQFQIVKDTNLGRFHDALYFSRDEYQVLTNQEVNDLAQARVQAWKGAVQSAKLNARAATKAEKQAERVIKAEDLAALDAEIAAMSEDPV